jgi:hypothetical protein
MRGKSLAFTWAGFAVSYPFRNGGLFCPRNRTSSLRAKEDPAWPQRRGAAPYAGEGQQLRAEVHREVQGIRVTVKRRHGLRRLKISRLITAGQQ